MAPNHVAPSVSCAAILCLGVAIAIPALAAKGGNKEDAWVPFQALFDAMAHPNCLNCHAARQTNYTPGGDGDYGLPTGVGHPAFGPFAGIGDEMDRCDDCHDAESLEYYRPGGVIDNELGGVVLDIRWHAAPISAGCRGFPTRPPPCANTPRIRAVSPPTQSIT